VRIIDLQEHIKYILDELLFHESQMIVEYLLQHVIHHSQNLEKQLNGFVTECDIMMILNVLHIEILRLLTLQSVVITVGDIIIMILDGIELMNQIFVDM
jgi:hypothetical protein